MNTKLFKLYNTIEFSYFESCLKPLIAEWLKRWMNITKFNLSFANACYIDNFKTLNVGAKYIQQGVSINISGSTDVYAKLLFGANNIEIKSDSPEIEKIIDSSLNDLCNVIREKTNIELSDIFSVNAATSLGSGWIYMALYFDEITLSLTYKPSIPDLINKTSTVNNNDYLRQLVQKENVSIDIYLDGTDICAGDLDALQIGDVLQLKHKIDEPLKIMTSDKDIIGFGDLGKVNDFYAINVIKQRS